MKCCVLVILLIFYLLKINAQVNFRPLSETCDFLYTTDNGYLLLGTVNGAYILKGIKDTSKVELNSLEKINIQSTFHSGRNKDIWFSTYNKIIRFNIVNGKINEYTLALNNDTLYDNYHLFWVDTIQDMIWIKQKEKIILYNIKNNSSALLCNSIDGYRIFRHEESDSIFFYSYYHSYNPTIVKIKKNFYKNPIVTLWKNWPKEAMAMDILPFGFNELIIGTTKGLFIGNINSETVRPLFLPQITSGVRAIGKHSHNVWIISTMDSLLHLLAFNGKEFELKKFPYSGITHPIQRIYNSSDNTIFLSSYKNGIYYFNPDKIKFINYNSNDFSEIENLNLSADKLKNYSTEISTSGKPLVFNSEYEIYCNSGYKSSKVVVRGKTSNISNPDSSYLFRFYQPENGKLYANFMKKGLYEFNGNTWEKVPYPENLGWEFNYYYPVNDSISLASINMSKLVLWNPDNVNFILWEMNFTGDVHNQYFQRKNNQLYLATEQGLVKFDIKNLQLRKIMDKHGSSCFCVLPDQLGNLWYSSLSGITKYNPILNQHRYFYYSDGTSSERYTERKCIALSPDSLLFFHTKGATLIVPSQVTTLSKPAKIIVSQLKINDLDYPIGDTLNYSTNFNLNYSENTLSFYISAIDWSDPAHTNLRYMLKGYDETWVVANKDIIFVKYVNLPSGRYYLLVQGASSNEVWNAAIKKVPITIRPPFWLTWWFLTLSVFTVGGILYYSVRSYYQRKLAKKNQLLREQSLIIEKQQAVENERTRIASEMHDDLGSGLTTIRYLSDKALIQAKDSEEATQIKRIADHSNTLVRNMSEIIWAMNSRFDNTENLIGYLRRYASEYLDERQMPFTFEANGSNELVSIGGEKRRNIFLIFKELLHNSIKYSKAKSISIFVETTDNFSIRISEIGGIGFDPELSMQKGNGLFNIQKRLKSIDGEIAFDKTDDAMHIIVTVPINVTNLA